MTDDNTNLEGIDPSTGLAMYIDHRRTEVAESTLQAHRRRLDRFASWIGEQTDMESTADLSGRDIHEWRLWRQGDGSETDSLSPETLRSELLTIRVFLRFLESIDAVTPGLDDKVLVPEEDKRSRTEMLPADRAEDILEHLDTYRYAADEHCILGILWATGIRTGTLRALDIRDIDIEERSLRVRHRPETGTPLKNGPDGERYVSISDGLAGVIDDYADTNRSVTRDEHGRRPLLATESGRRATNSIRRVVYYWTTPCRIDDNCPHGRDIDECVHTRWDHASGCPSSVSPHAVRRGAITHHLRRDAPKTVVSDRMDVSPAVLDAHYNQLSEKERMERRRGYLDDI